MIIIKSLSRSDVYKRQTLGIDVKKLDNAEAQREKEKTTLYTRNIIVETLQTVLPQVVSMCINAYHLMKNEAVESVEVNLPFGEYANPSFESQVETVGKAKPVSYTHLRKRKNVKSVISITIHNLKFQLQKDCNRYIKTAVDHPTKDSIYRSLLKDIIS